jgi:hypothetical protein
MMLRSLGRVQPFTQQLPKRVAFRASSTSTNAITLPDISINYGMVVGRVISHPWTKSSPSGGKVWGCIIGTARYGIDPNTKKYSIIRERHIIKCFDDRYLKVIEETVKRGAVIMAEGSLRVEPERILTELSGVTVRERRISLDVHHVHRYTEYIDLARPFRSRIAKLALRPKAMDAEVTASPVSSTESDTDTKQASSSIL